MNLINTIVEHPSTTCIGNIVVIIMRMYPLMLGFKSYIYPFLLSFFWLELFLKMSNVVLGYEIVWLKKNNHKKKVEFYFFLKKEW